jgi:hypothetical protein
MSTGAAEKKKRGPVKRVIDRRPVNPFTKLKRRKYHVQTVELTGRLIRETWGNLSAVARILGVNRSAVTDFVDKHPELVAVIKEAREVTVDCCEWQFRDALFDREAWAIKLGLETLGKHRGWVRGVQIGGPQQPDGSLSPIPVTIILPQNGREFGPAAITQGASDGPEGTGEDSDGGSGEVGDDSGRG